MAEREKLIERLRKLRALANDATGNPEETATAAARLAEVMAKYGIEEAELDQAENGGLDKLLTLAERLLLAPASLGGLAGLDSLRTRKWFNFASERQRYNCTNECNKRVGGLQLTLLYARNSAIFRRRHSSIFCSASSALCSCSLCRSSAARLFLARQR